MPKGKAAIITGSTSGIGLGIARALAGAGCNVMLNGFGEPSAIERERTQIANEFGVRAAFNPADLAKPTEINQMVEASIREFGQIDIVVNNAGIQHTAPIERFPIDRWDAIIAINLSANFHTIRAALPHMRQRNWGRIVNIASTHGLVASVEKSAYVAAKHGVVAMSHAINMEEFVNGIRSTVLCPGEVATPILDRRPVPVSAEDRARMLQPGHMADLILYVAKLPSGVCINEVQITPTWNRGYAAAAGVGQKIV